MIEVEGPDGTIVEFPAGTPVADIEAAMRAKFGGPRGGAGAAPEPVQAVDAPAMSDPMQGRAVTAPGTTSGAVMGAIQGGEPIMTPEDEAAGQAIQQAWDATGRFDEVARVAEQFGRSFGEEEAAFLRFNEGRPVKITANATGMPTQAEQAVGEFVSTPGGEMIGAGMLANANATTFGMLDELAPILGLDADRVQMAKRYLQERNPGTSFAGEVAGSILPGGAVSRGVNTMLEGTRFAGISPLAGDTIAGMLAGGGEANENRLGGIIGGGAIAAGGGALGRRMFGGDVPPGPDVMPPAGGPMGGMGSPSGGRASAGAAGTPEEVLRRQRAEELGVRILPPQASREFADQQKMRELAKNNELGGPIRDELDAQAAELRTRFESFVEGTGSEQWQNPYAQGSVVANALETLAKRERTRFKALYKRAENAGELRDPVDYQPVLDFIAQQPPTTLDSAAPVLKSVREQLVLNDPNGTGKITLGQMEDIRQLINRDTTPGTPNAYYGGLAKQTIDDVTLDAGGDVYKQARAARAKYAAEFENVSLINDLIGMKPGGVDRRVALERVVEHITRQQTSQDSLKHFKGLLERAGPRGERAMRELQGAVMENIKDAAYSGITRDQGGGVVISPAKLNTLLTQLDRRGKLDVIFDKPAAQMLRDVNLLVQDIATAPPGTLNTAGTSSAIINALDMLAMLPGVGGLAAKGVSKAREAAMQQAMKAEVQRLLKGRQ
jgi:hypothetical protein